MGTHPTDNGRRRRNAANALLNLLNDPDRPAFEEAVRAAARRMPTLFQEAREDDRRRPAGVSGSEAPSA